MTQQATASPPAYLTSREARRWFPSPRTSKSIHPSGYTRLIQDGVASRSKPGVRIRLRAVASSGGWLTTREWIAEFHNAVTHDRLKPTPPQPAAVPGEAHERADRACAALGL